MLTVRMMLMAIMTTTFLCACDSMRNALVEKNDAEHARNKFLNGLKSYESGSYAQAEKLLRNALKDGLASQHDQLEAHKYLAFINCSAAHEMTCRSEFIKAFNIDPAFRLEPEEEGNPYWGSVYREVKNGFVRPNTNSRP